MVGGVVINIEVATRPSLSPCRDERLVPMVPYVQTTVSAGSAPLEV